MRAHGSALHQHPRPALAHARDRRLRDRALPRGSCDDRGFPGLRLRSARGVQVRVAREGREVDRRHAGRRGARLPPGRPQRDPDRVARSEAGRHGAPRGAEGRGVLRGRRRFRQDERRAAQAARHLRPHATTSSPPPRPRGPFDRLAHAAGEPAFDPRGPHRIPQRHRAREVRASRQAPHRMTPNGGSMNRFIRGAAAAVALVSAFGASLASAQNFPQRTVTLVVPYAPGGLPDTVARVVGQKLSEKWGQAVVVENKPGGNGVVSAGYLASKPADGYTLQVTDGTMFSVNPWIYKSLPYDPIKDFTFISLT